MRKPHVSPLGLLTAVVILLAVGMRGSLLAAEETGKEAAGATLRGTVVDLDGKPVVGAQVSCHSCRSAYTGRYEDPIAQTTTGEQGRFELGGFEVEDEECALLVRADGFADALLRQEVGRQGAVDAGAIKLGPPAEIKGRVADSSGKPVEGAWISFLTEEYFSSRPAFSGPDGVFVIGYAPRVVAGLEIAKEGYNDHEVSLRRAGQGKPLQITLVRAPSVSGIVTDAKTGKPVEGASVYCMRGEEPVKTDAEGRYTFTDLDEGERRFAAIAPGLSSPALATAILRDDETTIIDFALEPSRPIRGRVVDGRSKKPIAGVTVGVGIEFTKAELAGPTDRSISIPGRGTFLIPEGRSMEEAVRGTAYSPFAAVSDENGEFAIPCSLPEMVAVYFHPADHLDKEIKLASVDLAEPLLVELDEGGVIAGRVLDPDGRPAAGVTVMCGIGYLVADRTTDNEGRFRFGALFANRYALAAVDEKKLRGAIAVVGLAGRRVAADVELKLVDAGYITGTLSGENDERIGEFKINFYREGGNDLERRQLFDISDRVGDFVRDHLGQSVNPATDGRYSSGPLLPGIYKVAPWRRKGPEIEARIVTLAPGETARGIDFTYELEQRVAVTVSGRVVDQDGKPIAGARVSGYSRQNEEDLEATSGEDGAFTLAGLDPGECGLSVSARRYISDNVGVTAPADDVLVRLFLGGAVAGRVVDAATGEPVDNYQIGFEGPPEACGEYHGPTPDEDSYHPGGRFEVDGLEAGAYDVTVYAHGYAESSVRNIQVEEDGVPREVLIKLVEGTEVTLRVKSAADGKPIGGASIGWHEYADAAKTRNDGTAVFRHRAATPHRLLVRKVGYADKWITFTPPADKAEMTLDVALDKGVTVRGRVVDLVDEQPIPGVFVIMTRDGWPKWDKPRFVDPGDRSARTDSNGEFAFDLVSNEDHILTFQHGRHVRTMVTKRFGDKTTEELVVKMGQGGRVVGIVSGPQGEPVSGAAANLSERMLEDYDERTDSRGSFSFGPLPPGTYELHVRGGGAWSLERIVEVREGAETRADVAFAGASLSGTVTRNGEACAELDVWIRSKRSSWSWASQLAARGKTDEQGRCELVGVPPGHYVWAARLDDGTRMGRIVSRTVRLGEGKTELNIELEELPATSSISGVITSEDGSPLPAAWMWIERSLPDDDVIEAAFAALDGIEARPTVNADGTFTCSGLEPGGYVLYASCRGYETALAPVEKPAGENVSNVAVKLRRKKADSTAALSGTARTEGGGTPWRLRLTVLDEQGRRRYGQWGEVRVKDGGYLVRVPAGTLKLIAEAEGYAPIVTRLAARAGTEKRLDLQFTAGSVLTVTVVDEAGAPVPEALVVLDADGDPWFAAALSFPVPDPELARRQLRGTGPDGTITLKNAPDGDYTVRVRRKGYRDASASVRIAGADAAVTVRMPPAGD